jgi:hypothetical protein
MKARAAARAFMRSSVMHNYSGPPMQNLSGVDTHDRPKLHSLAFSILR